MFGASTKSTKNDVEHIKNDDERMAKFTLLWHTVEAFLGEEWLPSYDTGLEIYGKTVINRFGSCDDANTSGGIGLYIGPSVFDHSCDPNAQVVYDGRKLLLREIKDIDCDTADGVRIAYIDLLKLQKERAAELKNKYYFDCDCSRCAAEKVTSYLTEKSPALTRQVSSLWSELKLAESPSWEAYMKFLEAAERFIAANGLPENDIAQEDARKLATYCSVRGRMFEFAVTHLKARVQIYRKCYGQFHPVYSNLLFNLASALRQSGRDEDALKYFKEASNSVAVSHGKEHPRYQMLTEAVLRCTVEIAARNQGIPDLEKWAQSC